MEENRGRASALLPIGVFLVIFLGAGIITGDFYAMPAIVAFLAALFVAFLQDRKHDFNEKIHIIAQGVGDDNIITMCLIFLAAGAFSGAVTAAGGAESTVNFGLSILPAGVAVPGLFIIGCFISVSMGTSMGTIGALAPIAVQISEKTGFSMAICIGAVMCGAMFGDNLSMISDTTIAAVKTQGCEMKDKFRENFLIVLPAAILTVVIFFLLTRNARFDLSTQLDYNLLQVLPYLVVLVGALIGINVFLVLVGGTVLSLAVGVGTGTIVPAQMFQMVAEGPDGLVGFVCFLPEARDFTARRNTSEIAALYLLRSAQGLGLGRRLLEAALGHLPPHQDVALYVLDKNRRAIRFYEFMGFRLTGRTLRQETEGGPMAELEMLRSGREG